GLAGAGVLFALRQSERSDLEQACFQGDCLEAERPAVRRANLYGTLSAVSLGAGLAAGAGLVTYLVVAKREPKVVGGAAPIAGGWALSVGGRF
ncbi:MAG TPA: hypothetical protein VFS00_25295, partial [Polyangiaceae bacterium]|nr:hypothetical protein [Polyangiaceae bacterium]